MPSLFDDSGAIFSDDRKYRYALCRMWFINKPLVMFVGLNPSTANETQDDPTIRRVCKFAFDWDFGGVYMTNLFAWVTPYPQELLKVSDPLGDNDKWLQTAWDKSAKVIFAWGAFKEAKERAAQVSGMFTNAYCLGKNADGSPKHPLYIKGDTTPIPFNHNEPFDAW